MDPSLQFSGSTHRPHVPACPCPCPCPPALPAAAALRPASCHLPAACTPDSFPGPPFSLAAQAGQALSSTVTARPTVGLVVRCSVSLSVLCEFISLDPLACRSTKSVPPAPSDPALRHCDVLNPSSKRVFARHTSTPAPSPAPSPAPLRTEHASSRDGNPRADADETAGSQMSQLAISSHTR